MSRLSIGPALAAVVVLAWLGPLAAQDTRLPPVFDGAAAVAVIGPFQLSGLVAWLAWLLVHIVFLIGFRNRFLVLFEWAWAYVSWQRGARLITRPGWRGRT